MLAKKFRLAATKDIEHVHKKGTTFFTPFFVLKFVKNTLEYPRVAFIVSTKAHGNATKRNALRRLLSSQLHPLIKMLSGYDILFIASRKAFSPDGKKVQKEEIIKTIPFALDKAHLYARG